MDPSHGKVIAWDNYELTRNLPKCVSVERFCMEMENALKALEQAKARVANERKKLNEKRRKGENHHKYLMAVLL